MTIDTGERIDRILEAPIALNGVDQTLLMAATEIDRLCAHTVMLLRGRSGRQLLAALGILDPDRIVAMYYALPDNRREVVRKDEAWGYHIDHAPEGLAEVLSAENGFLNEMDRSLAQRARLDATVSGAVSGRLRRMERVMMRRQAGLPVDISEDELAEIEESERIGAKLLENVGFIAEELNALDDRSDLEAQREAVNRAVARMER
jgi:hypothetical protein